MDMNLTPWCFQCIHNSPARLRHSSNGLFKKIIIIKYENRAVYPGWCCFFKCLKQIVAASLKEQREIYVYVIFFFCVKAIISQFVKSNQSKRWNMPVLEVAVSKEKWQSGAMHNSRVKRRQTAILQVCRLMQQEHEASRWIMFMLENRLESVERVAKAIIPMNSRWLKWYIINEGNMTFITWGAFAEWESPRDTGRAAMSQNVTQRSSSSGELGCSWSSCLLLWQSKLRLFLKCF